MNIFIEGFLLQASLILALGAQNIFVLESGLKRQRHIYVAAVCSLCDAFLIIVGVAGMASVFVRMPFLKILFGILGVGFLFYYGVKKLKEGFSDGTSALIAKTSTEVSFKTATLLALGFSLLNPHVILDTVILVGGYSSKFPDLGARMIFGAGAASFSVLWFFGLALFSSAFSRLLNNPKSMKAVALLSGLILMVLSIKLGHDVISGHLP